MTDGPFTEAKEVLGGYWMIDVKSREEAIAWAKKCPASENEIIEIRQVQEMGDFSEEVQQAAGFDELQKRDKRVSSRTSPLAVSRLILVGRSSRERCGLLRRSASDQVPCYDRM